MFFKKKGRNAPLNRKVMGLPAPPSEYRLRHAPCQSSAMLPQLSPSPHYPRFVVDRKPRFDEQPIFPLCFAAPLRTPAFQFNFLLVARSPGALWLSCGRCPPLSPLWECLSRKHGSRSPTAYPGHQQLLSLLSSLALVQSSSSHSKQKTNRGKPPTTFIL